MPNESNIERIFIDIDGVLNRFTPFAIEAVGCPLPEGAMTDDSYSFYHHGDDGLVACLNEYDTSRDWTEDEFFDSLPEEAWSDCPLSAEGEWLVDFCCDLVGFKNVAILTTPSRNPNSAAGKMKWVGKYFPKMRRRTLIGGCKEMCASPTTLLIDDRNSVVERFEKYGGDTLLLPRPWNRYEELSPANPESLQRVIRNMVSREGSLWL